MELAECNLSLAPDLAVLMRVEGPTYSRTRFVATRAKKSLAETCKLRRSSDVMLRLIEVSVGAIDRSCHSLPIALLLSERARPKYRVR